MKRHDVAFRFILVTTMVVCSLDVSPAASGLAAYWSFNEGTGDTAHDASGNGNNGIITGAQWTTGVSGEAGTALQFGGTDRVSVPNSASLQPANVTVEAWAYSDSFQACYYGIFVTKEYGSSASYRLQLEDYTGTLEFVTDNTWFNEIIGATVLANHQWHQLVGEWANDSLKVFVDGKLDGAGLRSGTIPYSTDPLLIGYTENATAPFNGKIDLVRIFNYALPPETIMAHYNSVMGIPTLSFPANGAVNQPLSLTLTWGTVAGAMSYGLQLSSSLNFSSTVYYQTSLTATSQQMNYLLTGTTYYWRANAVSATSIGSWSTVWSFTTTPPAPAAPVLAAPTNGAANQPIAATVSWNSATYASSYRLQASISSGFASDIFDQSGVSATQAIISGLPNTTVVFWHVNAANSMGTSIWSPTWSFTTIPAPPSAPNLVVPSNGATGVSPTPVLSWASAGGASSYQAEISTIASFSSTVFSMSGLTATSTTGSGLSYGTIYYWRADAGNAGGASWSGAWSFTTMPVPAPGVPSLVSPTTAADIGTVTAPTLTWNASGVPATYRLQASLSSMFSPAIFDQSGITGTSQVISGIPQKVKIYWHVDAANASGTSVWSNTWSFSAGAVDVLPHKEASYSKEISFSSSGITYNLATASRVSIVLYDMRGRQAGRLAGNMQSAGLYAIDFDRAKLAAGYYLLEFKAGSLIVTKKVSIMR